MSAKKALANMHRGIKEICLDAEMLFRKGGKYRKLSGRDDGIAVCLTSFPERIRKVWYVLDSIFRQTSLPDKVILVLTKEEFPSGEGALPGQLLKFREYGLEIVFLEENFRCHNKYRYAFRTYRKATVVTVDDDCYYRKDMLERLLEMSGKYPGTVCANIAAVIDTLHTDDYSHWKKSFSLDEPSHLNLALGFAGVLYPPAVLSDRVLDSETAMELAPTADDLWLKANELLEGVKVKCGNFYPKPVTINGTQRRSLRKSNKNGNGGNERQWAALDRKYNLKQWMQ